jgi:hypothetical protein
MPLKKALQASCGTLCGDDEVQGNVYAGDQALLRQVVP